MSAEDDTGAALIYIARRGVPVAPPRGRVARDRAATRRATIDTAVVARRTKASAPSAKGAFKVRESTATAMRANAR